MAIIGTDYAGSGTGPKEINQGASCTDTASI
jgi:ABC-type molybdate transport system substrate-binding protein